MKKALIALIGMVFITLGGGGGAQAVSTIFFGEDLSDGSGAAESTRLLSHPNSDDAEAAFRALLGDPHTEDFEGLSPFTSAPLTINFGTVTATLSDPFGLGFVNDISSPDAFAGRYPISGTNYFDTVSDSSTSIAFSMEFSQPQVAFGFFGTDIGDPEFGSGTGGEVILLLELWGGGTMTLNLGNFIGDEARGSVLYFGVIDIDNPFTKITFLNSSGTDFFGIDDFTIASQVIPEPNTLLLLGSGLVLGGLVIRRRRRQVLTRGIQSLARA
jgi:hypothetical protein